MHKQMFTPENTASILKMEVGKVFAQVLEHAGVYRRTPVGAAAFARFIEFVNVESWKSERKWWGSYLLFSWQREGTAVRKDKNTDLEQYSAIGLFIDDTESSLEG